VSEPTSQNLSPGSKMKKKYNIYKNKCVLFLKKTLVIGKKKRGINADKKLIFSLNKSKMPNWDQLKYISHFLSRQERKIIQLCVVVILISLAFLSVFFYRDHIKLAPARGGSYTEVLTGSPKFINPLYDSINTVDSDIVSLVYSGLLKKNKDSELVPDLAEKFEISEDQRVYTFYLKKNIYWHDDSPFTANDVFFTFKAIDDVEYKSPLKSSFDGVEIQRTEDDGVIKFILNEPYAAFLELLTVGILPSEIWQQIPPKAANLADLNLKPIGTGPYKFKSLTKDKAGNIKSYELEVNKKYFGSRPYIENIVFKFAPSFEDGLTMLADGRAEGIDFLPKEYEERVAAKDTYNHYYLSQPQFTALFFNQNKLGALSDKRIKQALAYSIDKQTITASLPHARFIDSAILPMFKDYFNDDIDKYGFNLKKAEDLLDNAGWGKIKVEEIKNNEGSEAEGGEGSTEEQKPEIEAGTWRKKGGEFLTVNITTVKQADTVKTAKLIKESWEKLNIKVNLNVIPAQQIQGEIIKPRNYQILLYGIILGSDPDQYPFWHSSQIGPSGLNLANYNNKTADALLEDGRITNNKEIRQEKYKEFQKIIAQDLPAIFLYSQRYSYLNSNKIKGFDTSNITVPSDRFNNITNWYIKTRKKIVW